LNTTHIKKELNGIRGSEGRQSNTSKRSKFQKRRRDNDTDHQLKRHGVREKFKESQSEQRIQIITRGTTRQREEGY